jgi:hypothetical protein
MYQFDGASWVMLWHSHQFSRIVACLGPWYRLADSIEFLNEDTGECRLMIGGEQKTVRLTREQLERIADVMRRADAPIIG